jgi:hypothetical protein
MLMSGQRCCKVDHDVVVLKLGTVVVNDSIHMMIERDLRRKARSTNTAAAENSEYRFRAPHPLLSSSSSSRQATLVMVSEDDDDTIVILEDDFMSSNNSITTHN